MKFQRLQISQWKQFEDVDLTFHSRVTIITGANGAGKSSILKILAKHFGWGGRFYSTPLMHKSGELFYDYAFGEFVTQENRQPYNVGYLTYSNGGIGELIMADTRSVTNDLSIRNEQAVDGVHITSHRPMPIYKRVENIPTTVIDANHAYSTYLGELLSIFNSGYSSFNPAFRMKESIISMAMFGPGNKYVQANHKMSELLNGFKDILRNILPTTLGFIDIAVRIPDVVIVTKAGEFIIDAASGGLMALIDVAWQIFLYTRNKKEVSILFDEPENHLHPSMQRTLLKQLTQAFPDVQFIIATHSPFIVSSIRDSRVYVLKYAAQNVDIETKSQRVISQELDHTNRAADASEVLRDVLGVPVTMPEWVEQDLQAIVKEFAAKSLDSEAIKKIRSKLQELGLDDYYPEVLHRTLNDDKSK